MVEVVIDPLAEQDYQDAFDWYVGQSPQAADRFQAAFVEAIKTIEARPTLYPAIDPIHRFVTIRRYPYRLIYRIDGDRVRIVAVAHAKRRPGGWLGRS